MEYGFNFRGDSLERLLSALPAHGRVDICPRKFISPYFKIEILNKNLMWTMLDTWT